MDSITGQIRLSLHDDCSLMQLFATYAQQWSKAMVEQVVPQNAASTGQLQNALLPAFKTIVSNLWAFWRDSNRPTWSGFPHFQKQMRVYRPEALKFHGRLPLIDALLCAVWHFRMDADQTMCLGEQLVLAKQPWAALAMFQEAARRAGRPYHKINDGEAKPRDKDASPGGRLGQWTGQAAIYGSLVEDQAAGSLRNVNPSRRAPPCLESPQVQCLPRSSGCQTNAAGFCSGLKATSNSNSTAARS